MTSKQMLKTKLPSKDHWFENVAKLGSKPNWQIKLKPEAIR